MSRMHVDAHNHLLLSHGKQPGGLQPRQHVAIDALADRMHRGGLAAVGLIAGGIVSFPRTDAATTWIGTIDGLARFWKGIDGANDVLAVIGSADDVDILSEESPSVLLGIEGWDPLFDSAIDDPVEALRLLSRLGVRSLQLLGHPECPGFERGSHAAGALTLSDEGRRTLQAAVTLGMVVDLSHFCGDEPAFDEILDTLAAPPMASHHSCRALTDHPQALSDEAIGKIAAAKGVIGIHVGTHWLTPSKPQATPKDLIRHLEHVIDLVGIDHVAIGTDHIDLQVIPRKLPDTLFMAGFSGPEDMGVVDRALRDHGFTDDACRKVLSDNVLRVWKQSLSSEAAVQ